MGLEPADDLDDLLARSTVVISLCPPAVAEELAQNVAARGFSGLFVEANAVNPVRVGRIAERMAKVGARPIDGAVIGPPPGVRTRARLHLSGPSADLDVVAALFDGTAVDVVRLGNDIGRASALKMAFASYQKATRTLAAVAHALATRHGVEEHLLTEARLMANHPLAEPDYLPGVAARAWRWSPEMLEVEHTLADAGLPDELARAAAEVLRRWEPDRDRWDLPLADVLAHLADRAGVPG